MRSLDIQRLASFTTYITGQMGLRTKTESRCPMLLYEPLEKQDYESRSCVCSTSEADMTKLRREPNDAIAMIK